MPFRVPDRVDGCRAHHTQTWEGEGPAGGRRGHGAGTLHHPHTRLHGTRSTCPTHRALLPDSTPPHTNTHTHTHQGTLLSFLGRRIWAAGREGTSNSGRNLPPDPELTGGAQRYRNPGNDLLSVSNLRDPDHGFQGLPSSFLLISFNRHPLPVDTRGPARIRVAREAHLYLCKDGWVWEPLEACKPLHRWAVAFSEIRDSDTSPLSERHSRRAQGQNSMPTSLAGSLHQRPSKQCPWAPLRQTEEHMERKGGRTQGGRTLKREEVVTGKLQGAWSLSTVLGPPRLV